MPERNVVSWNAMIAGFGQNGLVDEALKLFKEMPERSVASWNAMIAGCSQNGLVTEALKLFQNMPQRNVLSWTAMISGFAQSGLVDEALKVFKEMPQRNVVSWNAITAGFAQNGHSEEALNVFQQMQLAGVEPNSKTFASILPAYANLGALEQGTEIHEKIIRSGLQNDVIVVNALIDMYAKCGSVCKARELFDNMHQQDVVSWTAMIGGYAMHGCSKEALKLFEQMTCSGMSPNHVTLVCVLSACSHTGLVNEGYQYFNCMSEYHIKPTMDHYSCMVDLLGRAGLLDEAHNFIIKMPIKPDAAVWSSLLGACRIHNNIELGEWVAERLLELDSEDAAPYLLLSNIYAAEGRWDDIGKIRKMMKDRDIKKTPGCSWIEVNKQVHTFLAGDRSRPRMEKIYMDMERMCHDSKVAGYLRSTTLLLNNADKKGEEQNVCHHYKNLETAHGLLNSHLWKNYSCHQKLLSV
jgi:pentatricopeptide repeat protein